MPDLRPRLEAALAGSFTIERELGQGGMATVYLALDLRHGRRVALKVFLPEIASAFGHGRFIREIRTAANLSHPNILTLHDSGESDGLLWYVMPYVEGESLAQRIQREGPLPIQEALAITRQVAAALGYAHRHGVVHRDIKPGNILLSGGNAYVADFGIAHALEETGERLTSTGIAIGTPAYMSPEQSGSGKLDGRADIYSLGCVLYEMLVGEPPFVGRSAQVILARHSVERVPSARAVRDTIPPVVEEAIHRAMAKTPADRYATADEFAAALAPERLSLAVPVAAPPRVRRLPHRWVFALGSFAGLGLVVLVALAPWSHPAKPAATPDPNAVAVLPFAAFDPSDTAVTRLAGELAGLFVQHLPGDGGPRAVADSAAAGLRLRGTLARLNDRLVLSARLVKAPSGELLVAVEKVTAPADSVTALVDRALARMLAATAGEAGDHTAALAALPLPVIRSYLAGRTAYFRGEYAAAVRHYSEVLASDSTVAPAALGLSTAALHVGSDSLRSRGVTLANRLRGQLSPPDRLYLAALETYQAPALFERLKVLTAWNEAVDGAPDRAELWYELGEALFHEGSWTGAPDVLERANAAFRRALALEPGFVPALGHLLDLSASEGNTTDVRALGQRYLALDSIGNLADYYRWRVATALRDEASLQRLRQRLDSLSEPTLERIINVSQLDGVALEDGVHAAEALWARGGEWQSSRWRYTKRREIALNRGRPEEARAITKRRMAAQPLRSRDHLSEVVDALYWEADTTLATQLVAEAAGGVDRHARESADPANPVYFDVCAVSLWRLAHSDLSPVPASIADLRRGQQKFEHLSSGGSVQGSYLGLCADVLEAQLAAATGARDLRARTAQVDSSARRSDAITWVLAAANLTAARLWEQQGDLERALTATRRRVYITDINEQRVLVALSTLLREEGRLAARTGDRQGAIRAFRKYLALRSDAEPAVAPQVARVRAALDSLERSTTKN